MNTRLKQFLSAENITQSQFADSINVVRASVSHVLSGRNNPSYDFIKAIMSSYPQLNIEWLIFGKGKMYKETLQLPQETVTVKEQSEEILLFSDEPVENEPETGPYQTVEDIHSFTKPESSLHTSPNEPQKRKVKKVIILYDDDSYQEI